MREIYGAGSRALLRLVAGFSMSAISITGAVAQERSQIADPVAPTMLAERFDDWVYRCAVPVDAASGHACELAQSVLVEDEGEFVEILNVALSRAHDRAGNVQWALIVLAPQDVHLPSDFGLSLGDRDPVLARYRNCNQLGCWVVFPANDDIIDGLKREVDGAGHFRLLDGQVVKIVFSLRGFSRGFQAIDSAVLPVEDEAARE